MDDLISRKALLTVLNVCKVTEYDETGTGMTYLAVPVEAIEKAPAVDAVPVVRCKDCINHDSCTFEDTFKLVRIEDGYCRVGKRRADDE